MNVLTHTPKPESVNYFSVGADLSPKTGSIGKCWRVSFSVHVKSNTRSLHVPLIRTGKHSHAY